MSFNRKKQVVVAMSGGVDSSAAALLLLEQGYDVVGLTGIMFDGAEVAAENAAKVCDFLNIRHEILDLREKFNDTVINYFEESYKNGLTPNPCTFCNKTIKWGEMADFVFDKLNADYYATGHYARIIEKDGHFRLYRALDLKKDQTYMLFNLSQQDLSRTIFPLGKLDKPKIREIAEKNNLPTAKNKESQDVCFIQPPETTQSYFLDKFGEQEGEIIECTTGKVLGRHKGIYNYTVGQRKGICISAPEPLYVVSLDPNENKIYVGYKDSLSASEFEVEKINWQQEEYLEQDNFQVMARIRYNSAAQSATIVKTCENTARVIFDEPKYAITPGQSAVFYDLKNEYLLGGGIIRATSAAFTETAAGLTEE